MSPAHPYVFHHKCIKCWELSKPAFILPTSFVQNINYSVSWYAPSLCFHNKNCLVSSVQVMHQGMYNDKKQLAESPCQSGSRCVHRGCIWFLGINADSQEDSVLLQPWDPSCHQKAVLKEAVMFPFHPSYFLEQAWTRPVAPYLSLCTGSFGDIMLCFG